jgi:antitoxin (DNA-binding transcriptional repressor) of toxin-antitoxin stability system
LESGSTGAKDQGIAISSGAKLVTGQTFESVGGNVTLTDGGIAAAALEAVQKQASDYSSALKDILQKTNDAQSSQQTYALGKIKDLAESKQTDGVSIWKKPVVIVGVVLLLVIGWIAYTKK